MAKTIIITIIVLLGLGFCIFYSSTFSGHIIQTWTHGPFNFECGIYKQYADGKLDPGTTTNDKLIKHFLCAVLYRPAFLLLSCCFVDPPCLCSILGGAMVSLFGCWLYLKTQRFIFSLIFIFLLGFSFTTWYSSSVWESRSFIGLGAFFILMALDRFILYANLSSLLLLIFSQVFLALITVGNIYVVSLLPLVVISRIRQLGIKKTLTWAIISPLTVLFLVALIYQGGGKFFNSRLYLQNLIKISQHEKKLIFASCDNYTASNIIDVAVQAAIYSVGGLRQPTAFALCLGGGPWAIKETCREYFSHPAGVGFISLYILLILIVGWNFFSLRCFSREPLLIIIIAWFLIYLAFFTYFNPKAGPVYAAELQVPLWAFFALVLSRARGKFYYILPVFLLFFLIWNNQICFGFLKDFYGDKRKTFPTINIFPPRGHYYNWMWRVDPEKKIGNKVRVEIAHAKAGEKGAFRIIAWADTDGDGGPDRQIASSKLCQGDFPGDWSSYEFYTSEDRIFVGHEWDQNSDIWIFRSSQLWPENGFPLSDRYYYNVKAGKTREAGPAITSLKIFFGWAKDGIQENAGDGNE